MAKFKFKKGDKVILLPEYRQYPMRFVEQDYEGNITNHKVELDPDQVFEVEIGDEYTCWIQPIHKGYKKCTREFAIEKLFPASRAAKLLFF